MDRIGMGPLTAGDLENCPQMSPPHLLRNLKAFMAFQPHRLCPTFVTQSSFLCLCP